MDTIPEVSLAQMKVIKAEMMDNTISPELIEELGNGARLLCSWLDGILEFTILKHEVIVLRMKNNKVLEKIRAISRLWPKKKDFIEGAYKLLLFTKNQRRQANYGLVCLKQAAEGENCNEEKSSFESNEVANLDSKHISYEFMNFRDALNRVIKLWYEQRIDEETFKNRKLRLLHDELTKLKLLRQ